MAILATVAIIGSAAFGAFKLTPRARSVLDDELSLVINKTEYRRRRRRGNWPNPVDAPLFYC